MNTNKKIISTLLSLNILLISFGLNINSEDYFVQATGNYPSETMNVPVEKAPQIALSYNKNWTNNTRIPVNVSVTSPENKAITTVWLPNGQMTNLTSFTYTVEGNGIYTFKAMDSGGAYGYVSAIVDKIDTKTPVIIFTTPSGWLNQDPELSINVNNQ